MAKGKVQKGSARMAQSHLRARMSYLYSASVFLQAAASGKTAPTDPTVPPANAQKLTTSPRTELPGVSCIARQYASQLRAVSLKSQLRLPQGEKRSLCKRCDTLLVLGTSCSEEIENKSRGGRKPWADVRVVKCLTCGTAKRFPQGKERSMRLVERKKMDAKNEAVEKGPAET